MKHAKTFPPVFLLPVVIGFLAGFTALAGPFPDPTQPTVSFVDRDRIEWEAGPFVRLWNLYRGDLGVLKATGNYTQPPGSNATALQVCSRNAAWFLDEEDPPEGEAAFYLVTTVISVSEEGLGEDSAGNQRFNENRCGEGYFCVTDITRDRFVMKVVDTDDLDHARVVAYGFGEPRVHISGQVGAAFTSVYWNPGWNFHVVPESVGYFEYAIEVCDATIAYVNDFGGPAPGGNWCPWTSEILHELPSPDQTEPDGIPSTPCHRGGR